MRILAVDPGSKRIGLAISDPQVQIARPLAVIKHISRVEDAARVVEQAALNDVGLILVGQSFDDRGEPTFEGRRAARLAAALRLQTNTPVILWDEAFSTQDARLARLQVGAQRKKRSGHLDDLAAAILLQSYLDAQAGRP